MMAPKSILALAYSPVLNIGGNTYYYLVGNCDLLWEKITSERNNQKKTESPDIVSIHAHACGFFIYDVYHYVI